MHLPELALLAGAGRGLAGLLRLGVEVERVVAEGEAHLVAVHLAHAGDRGPRAHAVRALEVRELDDRDGRLRVAAHGRPRQLHRHAVRLEQHLHVVLRPQLAREGVAPLGLALLA